MNNKVIKNASWIIGCKIIQAVINLVIGMITARYLGPSNYGIINYASSIITFVLPIAQLGFTKTIVKEFIERPDMEGKILGSALVFNLISSIACMGVVALFLLFANAGETVTITVGILFSFSLIFQVAEIIQFWFQSKLLSKYPAVTSLIAYLVVALYKAYLLVTGKSVIWFAVSGSLDYFVIAIILFLLYKKHGSQKLSFSFSLGKMMLSRSKHYIISTMMVTIFAQTDRIMLKLMLNEAETGYYSAAVACVGATSFVFAAIIDSMRPVILEEKKKESTEYEKRIVQLYSVITYLSLLQSLFMTLFAGTIVSLLYGQSYFNSISVLRIAVWYLTFSYYGSIRNIWILAEKKQQYLWIINLSGAVANVIINAILIPFLGAAGAAIASLITQFFTNVLIGYIIRPIRYNNTLMLKGLDPKFVITYIKRRGWRS